MGDEKGNSDNLSVPSAPAQIAISMQGFDDPSVAQQIAHYITDLIREISRYMNLQRLDGFTVAGDYEAALAGVDRGMPGLSPLVRSNNDSMLGVAMAVAVVRDGVLKKHLVLDAEYILPIVMCEAESEERKRAIYMLAHECAHIADLRDKDTAFPGVLLNERLEGVDAYPEPLAASLYEEYCACRLSAMFWPEQASDYAAIVVEAIGPAHDAVDACIRSYRVHGNIDRLIQEAFEPATRVIRLCAYLFGHLDAFGDGLANAEPVRAALRDDGIDDVVEAMVEDLRILFERRGGWTSRDEFKVLYDIVKASTAHRGMRLTLDRWGRDYLEVP